LKALVGSFFHFLKTLVGALLQLLKALVDSLLQLLEALVGSFFAFVYALKDELDLGFKVALKVGGQFYGKRSEDFGEGAQEALRLLFRHLKDIR
jgi:hypothetical protein